MIAAAHPRQSERLAELRGYDILDTPREEEFDEIVQLAADICEVPVAVLNFIDADRQWFKAEVGLGVRSTPLDSSLCSHVILENDFVEIPDTLADRRMSDNPLCLAEGGFRFYAGALLETDGGLPLGTLCTLDHRPRILTELQRRALRILAKRVMSELDLRRALRQGEMLRREIDHRVKNSLTSITAIVRMQATRGVSEETRDALEAVGTRIAALATLHEEFHQPHQGSGVDLPGLIERAVSELRKLVPATVAIHIDIAAGELRSEHAGPLVLIVNEFVSNSVKHGFAGGKDGNIWISARHDDGKLRLICRDDGAASADTLARLDGSKGLGTRIVGALAQSLRAKPVWSLCDPGLRLDIAARGDQGS